MYAGCEPEKAKVPLAVFDFDGTCIDGSSTVALITNMVRAGLIGPTVAFRIASWCFCYKLHLPQNESWVRGLVFGAFKDRSCQEVDEYMRDVYRKKIAPRWRPQALSTIEKMACAGIDVFIVSATFDPIAEQAIEDLPVSGQISTRMKIGDDGCYTKQVVGEPVEGPEKLHAFRRLADAKYGKGNWDLLYCFGDHYSDRTILEAAVHPVAVDPDATLARHARNHGWTVLDWEDRDAPPFSPC